MRTLHNARGYIYAGLASAIVLWLLLSAASFQKCEHERKNTETYKSLHEEVGFMVKAVTRLKLHLACTRATAAENDGAIAALSGIAVAWFTLALWITTDKLWRAGERQYRDGQQASRRERLRASQEIMAMRRTADAAAKQAEVAERTFSGLERPILLVKKLEGHLRSLDTLTPGYGGGPKTDESACGFMVSVTIANFGRSPAILEELKMLTIRTDKLPDILDFKVPDTNFHETIIEPGSALGPDFTPEVIVDNPHSTYGISPGVYTYGYIIYRDVYGHKYIRKFCYNFLSTRRTRPIAQHTGERRYNPTSSGEFPDPPRHGATII